MQACSIDISLEDYNDRSCLVKGDKSQVDSIVVALGGSWCNDVNGWLVPTENRPRIEMLISTLYTTKTLSNMETSAKHREAQKRYHRERSKSKYVSSDNYDDSSDSSDSSDSCHGEEKKDFVQNLHQVLLASESSDSADDYDDSSDDSDFPSPTRTSK